MRKKIFAILMATCLLLSVFAGCNAGNKANSKLTLKTPGEVVASTNGGFAVETENYVYFINGVGAYTDNNKYGKPLEGALMVAPKTDLTKAEVFLPKLMTAGYYGAGIYVYDGYVYYATPSTEKTNEGELASNFLEMCRTKVDGSKTEFMFRLEGNSTQYKFTCDDQGNVYCVYYNSADAEIISYNVATGKKAVLAEDVANVFFSDDVNVATLVYTKNIAKETSLDEENPEYYDYNEVYVVDAWDEAGTKVMDGTPRTGNESLQGIKFTITAFVGEYVMVSMQEVNSEYTYSAYASLADLKEDTLQQVKDSTLLAATTLVVSANELITNVTVNEKNIIAKHTINRDGTSSKVAIVEAQGATLLSTDGTYVYYYTSSSILARAKLDGSIIAGEEEVEQLLGDDAYNTSWFKPEVLNINGKETVLFSNSDAKGLNYIHMIDLTAEKVEELDDEGEVEKTYWANTVISIMTDSDMATKVTAIINDELPVGELDVAENSEDMVALAKVKATYEALTKAQKELVSEDVAAKITEMEEVVAFIKEVAAITLTEETITKNDAQMIKDLVKEYQDFSSTAQNYVPVNEIRNKLYKLDNVVIENKW